MTERGSTPVRRLRSVRPDVADETAASILPGLPRVGALDALLRDVDGLRLTLETDLALAAAAVESGAPGVAIDLIDSDRDSLLSFESRSLGRLAELASQPRVRGLRWWSRVPAAPFVAAAAIVGFLVGVVPSNVTSGPGESAPNSLSAQSSLQQLTTFAQKGETSQVRVTSVTLHNQLAALISAANNDPEAAQQALLMLSYEHDAIVQSGDSAELRDVLAAGANLAAQIRNALPSRIRNGVPVAPAFAIPAATSSPKAASKASPSPSPSPSASPKPSATPSPSAKPSGSPKPSPSQSGGPVAVPTNPAPHP